MGDLPVRRRVPVLTSGPSDPMNQDIDVSSGDTATAVSSGERRVRKQAPRHHDGDAPRLTRRQRLSRWDVRLSPYLYISPFFILFLIVGMFPLVYTAYVSVYDWSLIGGKGEFVGLQNYRDVIENPYFLKSAVNTISIFLLSSVPQILMSLALAAL